VGCTCRHYHFDVNKPLIACDYHEQAMGICFIFLCISFSCISAARLLSVSSAAPVSEE